METIYTRNSNINQTLIIPIGIPGSGKSTWSNKYIQEHPNTIILSRDSFRFGFCNSGVVPFYIEELITESIWDIFKNVVWRGYNIIIDQTNCKERDFKPYVNYVKNKLNVEFYVFNIDLFAAKKRNLERSEEKIVRDEDMNKMYDNYQVLKKNCKFELYGDVNIIKNDNPDLNNLNQICEIDDCFDLDYNEYFNYMEELYNEESF